MSLDHSAILSQDFGLLMSLMAMIARLRRSGLLEPEVAAPELAPHSFLSARAVFDDMPGIDTSGDRVSHCHNLEVASSSSCLQDHDPREFERVTLTAR